MTPFELSEAFLDELVAISPMTATSLGLSGSDHLWDDLSPAGYRQRLDMARRYRAALDEHLDESDPDQRHAAIVLAGYLDTHIEEYESGDYLLDLGHIYCSYTVIRDLLDIMPRDSAVAWSNIAARLARIGQPLAGWRELLAEGVSRGQVVARRQVESVIEQAEELAGPDSRLLSMLVHAEVEGFATDELEVGISEARKAAAQTAEWLRDEYLPHAVEEDGVGRERYVRAAEAFLGMVIDPEETYSWGWEEVARLRSEMERVASEIDPDRTVEGVIEMLETDPARSVDSADFPAFVQQRLDAAVADLDGPHFDVPAPARTVTVNLAPPGGALGAWYVQPSADWQRPGSVWYALGERTRIPVWQEVSTAYHEGFPGHHLQAAMSQDQSEHLSKTHRLLIWYPGYGEGWALYAERVMDELGYFELPEYRLGMLASQLFRAVRVVVDVGMHLGYDIPEDAPLHGGEQWSFEAAVDYLDDIAHQPRDIAVSEVKRYLGWPGQAITYKVGEREILDIRQQLEKRGGFDLKQFHHQVLAGGELRLDYLRERLLG
jgi:uncharacterized protein (DUF885 family)